MLMWWVIVSSMVGKSVFEERGMVVVASSTKASNEWSHEEDPVGFVKVRGVQRAWYA